MLYDNSSFSIFFGGEQERFIPAVYKKLSAEELASKEPFVALQKIMNMQSIIFLHQVHGNQGALVHAEQLATMRIFDQEGDFLITNHRGIGIAVATADCLPIIFYDVKNNAIGVIHAGWRGSVAEIAGNAFDAMQRCFGTQTQNIQVFFGPSAKPCCYCVADEVIAHVEKYDFAHEVLHNKEQKVFFDMPKFNQLLLQQKGIQPDAFNYTYNLCTLCNASFCSYRRQKNEYRQMTVVALKKYPFSSLH